MSLSVRELLEAGAHFGHQTHRWNPKMKPFIYGARNGIHIIDLQKTAKIWAKAYQAIVQTIARGSKVLFVGTKPAAQEVIKEEALLCGQYFINGRWLGGMLTNFTTIKSRIDRLDELSNLKNTDRFAKLQKKEIVSLDKERQKLEKSLDGIKTMRQLPGMVIIVDPKKEHIAITEARKLHIPIVAVTDTNCDPEGVNFAVPGNDDALKSIRLFLHSAAEACLEGQRTFEMRIQEETRRRIESENEKKKAEIAESEADSGTVIQIKAAPVEKEEIERLAAVAGHGTGELI